MNRIEKIIHPVVTDSRDLLSMLLIAGVTGSVTFPGPVPGASHRRERSDDDPAAVAHGCPGHLLVEWGRMRA